MAEAGSEAEEINHIRLVRNMDTRVIRSHAAAVDMSDRRILPTSSATAAGITIVAMDDAGEGGDGDRDRDERRGTVSRLHESIDLKTRVIVGARLLLSDSTLTI